MNGRTAGFLSAPLLALALAAFAIGTTEFVIVGLLPGISIDLGVGLPRAGLLVTGYALGVALGAPPVAALTARWNPYASLTMLMVVFMAGNLLCAVAPSYGWLMIGRIVASLTHGAFFGIGATVAAALVAPERRSAAIALMFSGLTLANVLGVPAGAWLGEQAGWRSTFWAVCLLGALALAALLLLLPRTMPRDAKGTGGGGWSILRRPRLLGALALTALGFGGIFATLTFLSPLLQGPAGLSNGQVNLVLLLFGLGLTIGNLIGGWAADRWPVRSMTVMLVALAAVELVLALVLPFAQAVVLTIFLWGISAFAVVPGLQSLVLDEAHDAPALASTLNIGAFNLGNAGAAAMASWSLDQGLSLSALPMVSAGLAIAALGVLVAQTAGPKNE
jgi:DHA1 family inner membrane transport protein